MRAAFAIALVSACSFQPGTLPAPIDVADGASDVLMNDAAIDVPPDAPGCPVDFVPFGTSVSVYKAMTAPANYAAAVLSCSQLGGNISLVRLDDQAETDALYTFMDDAVTGNDTNITRVVGQRHANGAGPATTRGMISMTSRRWPSCPGVSTSRRVRSARTACRCATNSDPRSRA